MNARVIKSKDMFKVQFPFDIGFWRTVAEFNNLEAAIEWIKKDQEEWEIRQSEMVDSCPNIVYKISSPDGRGY